MESPASRDRGPAEGSDHIGIDAPEESPGVPMEADPEGPAEGAHWQRPERQPGATSIWHGRAWTGRRRWCGRPSVRAV